MRTTTQDPLAEKYYDISPYAWCANNPVNLVDPDGMSPIYNRNGDLIGTDEHGLTGEAIIMDEKFFTQGMSFSEASFFNLSIDGLENDQALKKYNESFENLSTRPDYNGFITDLEARNWWKEGNGAPLYVDVSQIDLRPLSISDLNYNEAIVHNFFFDINSSIHTGRVYGNLTLTLLNKETGEVKIGPNDKSYIDEYDFNINGPFFSDFDRNLATLLIRVFIVGKGTPFLFYPYGKNPIISK